MQRTRIRLAKGYLLIGDLSSSREVMEAIKQESMEQRTQMHCLFLEAQLFLAEGKKQDAMALAVQGREIASSLKASHDLKRFENFLMQ